MDSDKMYELLQEVKQDVAVIKNELASMKSNVNKIDSLNIKLIEHEESIKQLKSVNSKMWGVISGIAVTVIAALIKTFIGV